MVLALIIFIYVFYLGDHFFSGSKSPSRRQVLKKKRITLYQRGYFLQKMVKRSFHRKRGYYLLKNNDKFYFVQEYLRTFLVFKKNLMTLYKKSRYFKQTRELVFKKLKALPEKTLFQQIYSFLERSTMGITFKDSIFVKDVKNCYNYILYKRRKYSFIHHVLKDFRIKLPKYVQSDNPEVDFRYFRRTLFDNFEIFPEEINAIKVYFFSILYPLFWTVPNQLTTKMLDINVAVKCKVKVKGITNTVDSITTWYFLYPLRVNMHTLTFHKINHHLEFNLISFFEIYDLLSVELIEAYYEEFSFHH